MPVFEIVILGAIILVGLLFLALGFWQLSKIRSFIAKARRANAVYVGRSVETSLTKFGEGSVYRGYQFTADDGKTYGCASIVGGSPLKPKNETVEILYDPQNPNKARINSRLELYGAPSIFLACGAGFLLTVPVFGILFLIGK